MYRLLLLTKQDIYVIISLERNKRRDSKRPLTPTTPPNASSSADHLDDKFTFIIESALCEMLRFVDVFGVLQQTRTQSFKTALPTFPTALSGLYFTSSARNSARVDIDQRQRETIII
ncbi:hypothetical protein EVAR_91604_1 [Eumeta japonica]|uniref:Uncharacterized protein n=1 Tax=Eumeta variegata TaxID=151549 RepID=A0A4C1UWI9_EUMVA|nr:hypothetical protein EVAR_91604_1 [Eumeta japonica]